MTVKLQGYLTATEAAAALGMSYSRLIHLNRKNLGPKGTQFCGRKIYTEEAIKEFAAREAQAEMEKRQMAAG